MKKLPERGRKAPRLHKKPAVCCPTFKAVATNLSQFILIASTLIKYVKDRINIPTITAKTFRIFFTVYPIKKPPMPPIPKNTKSWLRISLITIPSNKSTEQIYRTI
jgi:hypothetical protein